MGAIMQADIKAQFGKAVRQRRAELGLSQEKFALLIDMDRTYLASVEAGKRNVAVLNIQKIANGLQISVSELFSLCEKV